MQQAEELQHCIVGQVVRDPAEGQAGVEQVSEQQGRQVRGELPETPRGVTRQTEEHSLKRAKQSNLTAGLS